MLTVAPMRNYLGEKPPEKKIKIGQEPIPFNDDDLYGTIQPNGDVLVVTAWINGFIVKKIMVD